MKQSGEYFDIWPQLERAYSLSCYTHCVSIMNSFWSVTYCSWTSSENFSEYGEMGRIGKAHFLCHS